MISAIMPTVKPFSFPPITITYLDIFVFTIESSISKPFLVNALKIKFQPWNEIYIQILIEIKRNEV
ncbi:hypothetical protein AKJ51_02470 [candidate division MSBL1 archaeon SCGC-AAA382A20]|uniref:Uncharacterized protein n=1 Tax=candidate division MSBL1 archaeon SCGC-AAA382A20 TaxID=1698280 RepID=A0A133VKH3_9EURY|nr:hypothetical protein AKJ51_02470 [candidate division MSBL1 archaeon SCGC-AAA382A20]